MAVYEYSVLGNKPPIQKIITGAITGTSADTLVFLSAMTRFVVKNTGTASLTFAINGNASLANTLQPGETFDDSFPEYEHVVMSGTTGSSYKVMVG